MKTCSICSLEKSTDEFYKAKSNKDGLQKHCKKCDNARCTKRLREKSIKDGKKQKTLTLVARELRSKGLKHCPGCKEIKELFSFYSSKASNDGLASHCILCANKIGKLRPKEERNERYRKNKDVLRDLKLQKAFGISLIEYNEMLEKQNGVCAICGNKEENKSLAVDHCHKTGKIRGLLCGSCNPAIGFLKDNSKLAKKLVTYLERNGY